MTYDLQLANVGKVYDNGTPAVIDFNLEVTKGEFIAFLGPSGCGKTTTLRIVAGLDPAFEGRVSRPGQGRLGIVFQEPRLLPWRTVEENVTLARDAAGLPRGAEEPLYAMLGLSAHRDRYPRELSLGLARRAAIARAFAVEPDLLLLDEPFVSLDPETAARLRAELAALHVRTRPTTLLVTHDIDEALQLADVVFVLSGQPGRIVAHMPVALPREHRSGLKLAALRAELAARRDGRGGEDRLTVNGA